MAICNLTTLTVNTPRLGQPPLSTNPIDVSGNVGLAKNLAGIFRLTYASEYNDFKAKVNTPALNIFLNKISGVGSQSKSVAAAAVLGAFNPLNCQQVKYVSTVEQARLNTVTFIPYCLINIHSFTVLPAKFNYIANNVTLINRHTSTVLEANLNSAFKSLGQADSTAKLNTLSPALERAPKALTLSGISAVSAVLEIPSDKTLITRSLATPAVAAKLNVPSTGLSADNQLFGLVSAVSAVLEIPSDKVSINRALATPAVAAKLNIPEATFALKVLTLSGISAVSAVLEIPSDKVSINRALATQAVSGSAVATSSRLLYFSSVLPTVGTFSGVISANAVMHVALQGSSTSNKCIFSVPAVSPAAFGLIPSFANTPNILLKGYVLPVGILFSRFVNLSLTTPLAAVSTVTVLPGGFYVERNDIDCSGSIAATCGTAGLKLNIFINTLVSSSISNVPKVLPTGFIVGPSIQLGSALVLGASNFSSVALRSICALNSTVACRGSLDSAYLNKADSTNPILCISSLGVSNAKFGLIVTPSTQIIRAVSDQPSASRPSLGQKVYLTSPSVFAKSSLIAGLKGIFAVGYPAVNPANAASSLLARARLSGPVRFETTAIECVAASDNLTANLLVLGAVDYPDQVQEYVRYPLPTATSAASAVDYSGSPVPYSHSIFGSTLIRLTPTGPSNTAVGVRLRATQIGPPTQYTTPPDYRSTLVLLRTSILDTSSTQVALFGNQAVGPNVNRVATYSQFPRSYASSVASMGSGGATTLANAQVENAGTYAAPTTPVLFLGSALLRHNYNQSASISKPSSIVSDYYYPQASSRKLAKTRAETTVGNYDEGLSPIYSSSAFRLLTPSEYAFYSQADQNFQINAAVMAQDGTTAASANIHGSDAMISFLPIKQGARYAYSRYRSSISPGTSTVATGSFEGGPPGSTPLEFIVGLEVNGTPLDPTEIYSSDADCVLRVLLSPYTDSGFLSSVYIDIPVLGISVNDDSKVVIDLSYRWFIEQCLPGGAYSGIHTVRLLKDFYSATNGAPTVTTRAVLAVTRPVVNIAGDQGESNQNLLSFTNDRNLLLGEFSIAISRPEAVFDTAIKVNVESEASTALEIYPAADVPAARVSSFDPNSLHLFVKSDGTLGCRRTIATYNGTEVSTDPNPILPSAVRDFIATGGLFSQVKVGESVTALLSSGASARKLFLWGYNTYGQLDVPAAVDPAFFTQGYISNVKEFDFNSGHVAVILDNGKLYSWGCTQSTVWQSLDSSPVVDMAIGEDFSVAIVKRYDSANPSTPIQAIEQYGNSPATAGVPVGVTVATRTEVWPAGSAGQIVYAGKVLACGKSHAVLLKNAGTVVCWGDNTYGQCTVPGGLTGVVGVDAGDDHTIALKNDGTVVCWGRNNLGQSTVPSNLKAKSISAGGNFSLAVRSAASTDVSPVVGSVSNDEVEDTVACWGDNGNGQCTPPVCEGASYDPSVHKYRMRFWGVQCGWDHAIGIRKDNDSAKWFQHLELSRLANSNAIKLPFNTSAGTNVFPCVRSLSIVSTGSGYSARSSTGQEYVLTETGSGTLLWASPEVTVSGIKYRILWSNNGSNTITIQRTPTSPVDWQDVQFNKNTYSVDQTVTSNTFYDISSLGYNPLTVGWDSIPGSPTWRATVVEPPGGSGQPEYISYTTPTATGEVVGVNYATADATSVGLNQLFVAWGNPMAWVESLDQTAYSPYYPTTKDLDVSASKDIAVSLTKYNNANPLTYVFSYVGYGKQLGRDLIYSGSLPDNYLLDVSSEGYFQPNIYIGPRVLQIVEPANALTVITDNGNKIYALGSDTVFLTVSGAPRYFNRPNAVGAAAIRTYASPEPGSGTAIEPSDIDSFVQGFNNKCVYVEAFGYSLPAGYSIVANNSASLPADTAASATGYHIIFVGTVGGASRTLVMTGAWAKKDELTGNLSIVLPFDITYSPGGDSINPTWLAALGITIKRTRVVRQQLGYSAATYRVHPGKHLTSFVEDIPAFPAWNGSVKGLAISSTSEQVIGGVKGYRSVLTSLPLQYFSGFRSAVTISRNKMSLASKYPIKASSYGDNKFGQLNLKLFGPFAITDSELNTSFASLNPKWLMSFGQTQIGHTQNPSLTYGFSKVVCGQFHTLAIDEDGYVHAWGLNNAINPPKIRGITWDPFAFSYSGCTAQASPAELTGYFSSLSGTDPSTAEPCSAFNCNRAYATPPDGSTSSIELVDGTKFLYPNVPVGWSGGCTGSYTTDGVLLFDKNGFSSSVVLVSQLAGNQGFVIGLEESSNEARIYVSAASGASKVYSEPFDANPKLIYLSFPASRDTGLAPMKIKAKVDGTYVKWGSSYESPDVFAVSHARFLNCFGDSTPIDPDFNTTVLTKFKPVTDPTHMIAGDSFFLGLYNNEAEPRDRQCGSIMTSPTGPDFYPSGGSIGSRDDSQGGAFPALDFAGPKNYFISQVSRTYSQISGSVPAAGVYSGATATTLRYDGDANPNFKIYIGDEYSSPTEALNYSDESEDPGGRWPKVVFPNEPEWVSGLAHLPTEVYGFRALGNSYTSEQFQFQYGDPTLSNSAVYPAYPIAKVANELDRYVTYDVASRRLLPQSYEPDAVVTSPNSVALGTQCAFAIKSSNTIFSWGMNHKSQRADAANIPVTCQKIVSAPEGSIVLTTGYLAVVVGFNFGFPAAIRSVPNFNFTDVAIAEYTAAGIKQTDGTVVCWGEDYDGLLTPPSDLGVCTKVVGGKRHFAALTTDGKVVCWGDNSFGQLNVPVGATTGVVKIVAGACHTVALKNDGTVVCWGDNTYGQTTNPAGLGTGCLDIAAGYYHTVAIKSNNTLALWGADPYGTPITNTPTTGSYIKLGTGWSSGYAVAVRTPGTGGAMVSWGNTGAPYYTAVPDANTRRTVSFNPTSVTQIGPYKHVVVAAPTEAEFNAAYNAIPASIRARNSNRYYSSSELSGLEHAIAIAAGSNSYYAIKAATYNATEGTLAAWGSAGSDNALTVPTGSTFTSVSSRNRHAAALRTDGTVACWGSNTQGQAVSPAGTYSMVACGDTFTVAINASTNKLLAWGSISSIPAPYADIQFSTVSAGKAHIVGRALENYSQFVSDGTFTVTSGDVLAFGDNSKGQCNVPGFSYSGSNRGFNCPAVAGGEFTAYAMPSTGFQVTDYVGSSQERVVAFVDNSSLEDTPDESGYSSINYSDKLEGYIIHRAGLLCPPVLSENHPYSINPPLSLRTAGGDSVPETVQNSQGFVERASLTTNATNVPTAFRRGANRKAKLIAAGRYYYHLQTDGRFPYGAGYSVLVSTEDEVVVFGGDLLPSGCSISTYSPPAEGLAIRNIDSSGIEFGDVISQIDTFRANIYALKATGQVAHWGYDDVSTSTNPEFYGVNNGPKQYFSLPDDSLQDTLPRLQEYDSSNIAMSYISGIPGLTDSWSVDVYLDRYFNGDKTTIRRFSAVGQTSLYSINDPVHFAETFLALDTWPGNAQFLDSQYILSVVPRGVSCTVNSASFFALNLDSKIGFNRVFRDGSNMGSDLSQAADFVVVTKNGTDFESSSLISYGSVSIDSVSDSVSAITLTSSTDFVSPSFVRNSYGGSARLEYVDSSLRTARTGGRVASTNSTPVTPATLGARAWFKYESLPTTANAAIPTWASSITTEAITLSEDNSAAQPNVSTPFLSSTYRGAKFDNSTPDKLYAAASVSESAFTYFLVFSKSANTAGVHAALGKYALPSAGNPRVQGIGFASGKPVLFTGSTYDQASASVGNGGKIMCGFYGGGEDRGLRITGVPISSWDAQNVNTYMPSTGVSTGYHLGGAIAGATDTSTANKHDTDDVYGEVIIFENRLSPQQIEIMEGYLAWKFNVAYLLPGTHPYFNAPPAYGVITSVYNLNLQEEPLLTLDSDRLTASNGRAETWLGMFELGLKHNSKRVDFAGTTLNHHAPILAEFGFTVGITSNILLRPIAAACSVAAAELYSDTAIKVLSGRKIAAVCSVQPAELPESSQMFVAPLTSVSEVAKASCVLDIGLVGSAGSTLGIFGPEECDPVYGCIGVSDLPPDLTVISPGITPLPINCTSGLSAFLSLDNLIRFALIECKLSAVGKLSPTISLVGQSAAVSFVSKPSLRATNTFLGVSNILAVSNLEVCIPAFIVKPPSAPRIGQGGRYPVFLDSGVIDVPATTVGGGVPPPSVGGG